MSLLIKALDKAQAEKAQTEKTKIGAPEELKTELDTAQQNKTANQDSISTEKDLTNIKTDTELTLSPPKELLISGEKDKPDLIPASLQGSAAATLKLADQPAVKLDTTSANQRPLRLEPKPTPKQAANVFAAKGIETASREKTILAAIAGVALIAMLAMGVYYFQFVDNTPDLVISPRPLSVQPVVQAPIQINQPKEVAEAATNQQVLEEELTAQETTHAFEQKASQEKAIAHTTPEPEVVVARAGKVDGKLNFVKLEKAIASDSASIEITQNQKPAPAVNPALMQAYDRYNAGDDDEAQQLYKQVLQRDGVNIDAMLGLGAISIRQGRNADAVGWYREVLQIEPRNATAQAAILHAQQQSPQADESRIKSMLAKTPGDASLHAALGNLYAEHNHWTAAQQAYFDAFKLSATADNTFNLAISLDQMGKPKLALPYYQQALVLARTEASNVDIAALEARIASIQ